jgi:hypothetical protein
VRFDLEADGGAWGEGVYGTASSSPCQESPKPRREALQFLQVNRRERLETVPSQVRERETHHAMVGWIRCALNEVGGHCPVHPANDAVMPQQQRAGDIADGGPARAVEPPDGQEELVLGGRDPRCLGLPSAPVEKPPQPGESIVPGLESDPSVATQ